MDWSNFFAKCATFAIIGAVVGILGLNLILPGIFIGLFLAVSTSILAVLHDLNDTFKRIENRLNSEYKDL